MTNGNKLDKQTVEDEIITQSYLKIFNKPIFVFAFVTGSIFIAESIVMFILTYLRPMSIISEALLDSFTLIIFILPLLYLFLLRPMKLHLAKRKILESKLREASISSEEKYRLLFKGEQDAILLVDAETQRIVDANDSALLLYGYSRKEILRLCGPDLSAEPEKSTVAIKKVARQTDKYIHYHTRMHKKKDGTVFPVEISSGNFILQDKKIVSAMIRDITERKKAAEELEKHRDHLKEMVEERTKELKESYIELNKEVSEKLNYQAEAVRSAELSSIGELAAGVAHEINNPINGIINCAQILANKYEPESKDHKAANIIIKEGDRIASIISSLLSLARTNDKKKSSVRINEIMADVISLTEAQLRKDAITLKVDIPMDLSLLNANVNQLEQVFLNILTNARYAINEKYPGSNKNKIIKIKGEKAAIDSKTIVRLTFFDNGVGIPYDILKKIMNPFFTTKPANQGTGLGLSISHGIINDHGGTLRIDSIYGEFTNVIIDLPANIISA